MRHHPNARFVSRKVPENDFSIIRVNEEFELNQYVGTICLPKSVNDYDLRGCFATGFGKDYWGKNCIKLECW